MAKGGFFGNYTEPTSTVASGVWSLREQEQLRRDNKWPISIVGTGLILYLDAGSTSSYSGSGNFWNDLTTSGYNATLFNSPTFSNGVITFNGTTQGANVSPNPGTTLSNNFTWELWCKPTATHEIDAESTSSTTGIAGQKYIIGAVQSGTDGGAGISIGTNGVSVYEHGSAYMPPLLVSSTTISSTSISQIVVTYTSKQPRFYLNGSLIRTGLTSTKTNVYAQTATIGYGQYGNFQGDIAIVRTYDRTLSLADIQQNYDAEKTRFGL